MVEFRALGDLQVVEDGRALALGSHQQRAVLALLVLSAGEVVSSDRLIEALWGGRPPLQCEIPLLDALFYQPGLAYRLDQRAARGARDGDQTPVSFSVAGP